MPRRVPEMKPLRLAPVLLASLLGLTASDAAAQRGREQDAAYQELRAGAIVPIREVEARVMARMGGAAYLGPEYDPGSATYRLKFLRGGAVIWVDVDARTGREIGRSGR